MTGFLLAGVGHKDYRQNTNFLIVDTSKHTSSQERIAKKVRPNFPLPPPPKKFCVCSHRIAETTTKEIESTFAGFSQREDVAIIIIAQNVANEIRHLIERYDKAIPAILEIPAKDQPYDPNQDTMLTRVKGLLGIQ